MTSFPKSIESIRAEIGEVVASSTRRSPEEQRSLLADLLAQAFEATHSPVAG